jgi:hypothetical protein
MVLGISVFLIIEKKKRFGTHWEVNGPLYLSLFGGILMCLDPLRHVLQDNGLVTMNQYRPGCEDESMKCLSVIGSSFLFSLDTVLAIFVLLLGWTFTVGFTYVGRNLHFLFVLHSFTILLSSNRAVLFHFWNHVEC